ncbi:hypothetical protein PMAYCL1PPCAC_21105, partial [Pristionchus mayeri]
SVYRFDDANFKKELRKHLGSSSVFVHLINPFGESKQDDEPFIIISSIIDDCDCPEGSVILTESKSNYSFRMKKPHCFHLNCSISVEIAENLRDKYRLGISHYSEYSESSDTFVMKDGFRDFVSLHDFNMFHEFS